MADMYICARCFRRNGLYPLPLEDITADARETHGCRYCGWKGKQVIVTYQGKNPPAPSTIKSLFTPKVLKEVEEVLKGRKDHMVELRHQGGEFIARFRQAGATEESVDANT